MGGTMGEMKARPRLARDLVTGIDQAWVQDYIAATRALAQQVSGDAFRELVLHRAEEYPGFARRLAAAAYSTRSARVAARRAHHETPR
jgi:hypothetical protein